MKTTIYLVRHGETDWNRFGRLTSFSDVPLNSLGVEQASSVARSLAEVDFSEIRCSPMVRARQSAELIRRESLEATVREREIIIDERLAELSFGKFEGLTRLEMANKGLLNQFENWTRGRSTIRNTESLSDAQARATELFSELRDTASGNVLLVSHGHFARILVTCCALNGVPGNHRALRMDNGLLAQIDVTDDDVRLVSFNTAAPVR